MAAIRPALLGWSEDRTGIRRGAISWMELFSFNLNFPKIYNFAVFFFNQSMRPPLLDCLGIIAGNRSLPLVLARQANEPLEQRHKDLARSIQAMYEEAFFHLLAHLHKRYPTDNLVLAGGCA